jgi:hypothetical protein
MENIRQAIERAKSRRGVAGGQPVGRPDTATRIHRAEHGPSLDPGLDTAPTSEPARGLREAELDPRHLQSERIVSHVVANPLSRPFDMLRTQILQSMDAASNSKIIAVTSPTAGCGKTVTAVNLAFSIARQPERSVMLMDLDFPKPRVASCLGLEPNPGVLGVLQGRSRIEEAIVHARIGQQNVMVLPTSSSLGSSELMASRPMATLFEDLRRDYRSQIIIVDLPPILSSDDVIAILPQVDCALLVVAVGTTKVSEMEECTRHLQSTEVVRIAVNKVPYAGTNYVYK